MTRPDNPTGPDPFAAPTSTLAASLAADGSSERASATDPGPQEQTPALRVAVLGAGPVGLDAALAALEEGFEVRVWEAAPHPAAHVRRWGHVRLFSPWSMNRSTRMDRALSRIGLPLDVDETATPTGHELADRVLDPLWHADLLEGVLATGHRVEAVGREGLLKHEEIASEERSRRPFRLLLRADDGTEVVAWADRVIDCTGTRGQPNHLGEGGIPAPGERDLAHRVDHEIPLPDLELDGKTVLLVGAGHSAQTAACQFADLLSPSGPGEGKVIWVHRNKNPNMYSGKGDALEQREQLTRRAQEIAGGAHPGIQVVGGATIHALANGAGLDGSRLRVDLRRSDGTLESVEVDRILSLTGGVGDHTLYRQLQVHECYATCGPMKLSASLMSSAGPGGDGPADCLDAPARGPDEITNPEPGFYILGEKSYGRNSTFLLRTGWQQVGQAMSLIRDSVTRTDT